ncbi:MAG: 16S rRNA (adenine(1518)-N(6)/adenine(1519)-N(6))-dimethyltransferase RsmA [Alphaproteobacteria bacterium]
MSEADLDALPPLREVIATYGLRAHKGLGQHFLLDLNVTHKIARLAGDLHGVHVIEIGPGPGGLTRALLASLAATVTAIERDSRCVGALQNLVTAAQGRLNLVSGDALTTDLVAMTSAPRAIIANLPYNIGTELLVRWLKQSHAFVSMTLMFQREVAARICAAPGSKNYGRLAVMAQACCTVRKLFDLPARAFTPPPKVDSSVVHLTPHPEGLDAALLATLEQLTAAAFGQRRKMLKSSLADYGGETFLRRHNIDPMARAEAIAVEDFLTLASAVLARNVQS